MGLIKRLKKIWKGKDLLKDKFKIEVDPANSGQCSIVPNQGNYLKELGEIQFLRKQRTCLEVRAEQLRGELKSTNLAKVTCEDLIKKKLEDLESNEAASSIVKITWNSKDYEFSRGK